MKLRRPRVLFLCHSASRNGATILLLNLLNWLKGRVDWDIEVLIHGSGPLLNEFRATGAKTIVWRDPGPALNTLLRQSMHSVRRVIEEIFRRLTLPAGHYDLIYANTSATAPLVRLLARRSSAVLWHVHELSYALRLTLRDNDLESAFRSATRYIAVSNSVRQALTSNFGVPAERIDLVNGFVPAHVVPPAQRDIRRQRLRQDLHWPQDAFVVGGCGSLGWRKGTDVFLLVAKAVASAVGYENLRFLWIGGGRNDKESFEFEHDVRLLRLENICQLIPSTADVLDYYCAMDAFALTSREDPFPLVMLEAADQGLPVVCFEGSGGGTEFVGDDCGVVVPYLDVKGFADQIIRLHDDVRLREQLGRCGQLKVCERFRVEAQGPKLLKSAQLCIEQALVTNNQRVIEST